MAADQPGRAAAQKGDPFYLSYLARRPAGYFGSLWQANGAGLFCEGKRPAADTRDTAADPFLLGPLPAPEYEKI